MTEKQRSTLAKRDMDREGRGWYGIIGILFLFPILFFLCVFFPIWVGLTPRFP